MDITNGEILIRGLSRPRSPRIHQEQLWLLDSGRAFFGTVDCTRGIFEFLSFCPGYLRGLTFVSHFAVVGLSKPRENRTFSGYSLDKKLTTRNADARCALYVIDLRSGDIVYWLRIEGIVSELYDVVILPGVVRPMALGFKTDEIRWTLSVGESQTL